jgi:DNA-3-methyladenine glycosylase II
MSPDTFFLDPAPPFRLDFTVWTLRRRGDNTMDRWDGATYRRALTLADTSLEVAVVQTGGAETPRLRATVCGGALTCDGKLAVTAALERLLGLGVDLAGFYHLASRDSMLGPLARRFQGMKPPRFPTLFESLVNAIACQQITLTLGIRLLNRLTAAHGPLVVAEEWPQHAFPRPEDLAHLSPEALRELGFSRQKARAMIELSQHVVDGLLDLEGLAALTNEEALARLRRLRGVGRWSAEYVLLRGLGRTELFPGDDVGARNNLQRWLRLAEPLDYEAVRRTLSRWQPYGGLVYFHLLLDRLSKAGSLDAGAPPCETGAVNPHVQTKASL